MKEKFSKLFLLMLAAAVFFGCDDDDSSSNNTDTGKHRIVLTTTVGNNSYVGTIKDLSGSMNIANFYEHVDKAAVFVYKNMLFVTEQWNGDVLHKYIRTETGDLQEAGTITLPSGGKGRSMAFLSENKAYITLAGNGKVYIFNPTTLTEIGDINLTAYAVGDNNPDLSGLIIRPSDNKLFIALSQEVTMFSAHDSGYVAVIDANTDKLEKVIVDPRVTSLGGQLNGEIFMDENENIYIYSAGVFGFQPGANDGFLRINAGSTEFDPTYYFSPKNTMVSGIPGDTCIYAMGWEYGGNDKIFGMMMVKGLTSNPPDYENDKNAQPIMYDLVTKQGTKINLNPSSMFASAGLVKLDNKIVFGMSSIKGDGLYTYDLSSGEVSENPVVTTVGKPQFMQVFAD